MNNFINKIPFEIQRDIFKYTSVNSFYFSSFNIKSNFY